MDTILPSELPYVIGFIAVVIAIFWLIGRAADRGVLAGPKPLVFIVVFAALFGVTSVVAAVGGLWLRAAFYAFGCLYFALTTWRRWHRT